MNKIYWLIVFVLVVFAIASGIYFYNPTKIVVNNPQIEGFSKCLASRGVTMYGAYWCSHCQREKSNFGEYFKYINYVECPENIKLCQDKKITNYPTWEFPDGNQLIGEQGLQKLSLKFGCPLGEISAATDVWVEK